MSAPAPSTPRPGLRARWRALPRARRWAALACAAVALYLFCGFLVLPAVLRAVLPAQAGQALGRVVTLERVRFNPLTHKLTLEGLTVAEAPAGAPADAGAPAANATAPSAATTAANATTNATAAPAPAPFVSVRSLEVNASSFSLLRLAVLVDEVRLTGPRVHLIHQGEGQYNFSDIVRRLAGDEQAREDAAQVDPAGPFPLVVSNFVIEDGGLIFEDRPAGRTHTVEHLDLVVPFTSTLPGDTERDVEPLLRAVVNGTAVQATGRTRPFAQSLRTEFSLRLDALDLLAYAPYAPLPPEVRPTGGTLSLDMRLAFERSGGVLPGLALEGTARVDGLNLTWADGRELAGFESLELDLERLSLDQGLLRLAAVRLVRPHAALERDAGGGLDWTRLLPPAAPGPEATPKAARTASREADNATAELAADAEAAPEAEAPPSGFTVEVAALEVSEGRLEFTDHPGGRRLHKTLAPIALSVDNWTSAPDPALPASFSLAVGPADGEQLVAAGTATASPLAVDASLGLSGLDLPAYAPYYADLLPLRLASGTLRLGANCTLAPGSDGTVQVVVDKLSLGLARFALAAPRAADPLLTLTSLELAGGRVDLAARQVGVQSLTLDGAALAATRLESGEVDLAALLAAPAGQQGARPAAAPSAPAEPGAAWSATLERLHLGEWELRFADRTLPAPAALLLRVNELTLSDISWPMQNTMDYTLDAALGDARATGGLLLSGSLVPQGGLPARVAGNLELKAVPLAPFGPYLAASPATSALSLDRGTLSLGGRYELEPLAPGQASGQASGQTRNQAPALNLRLGGGLRGLALGAGGSPLAALEALDLRGLTVRVADLGAPQPVAALESLGLKGLALRDPGQPRDAAALAALTVRDARVDLPARSVAVAMVDVQAPELRLVVAPDGTLNLARIARRAQGLPEKAPEQALASGAAQEQGTAAPGPGAEATPAPEPFTLSLDTLAVDGGAVRFRDQSLSPAFSSTMENLTLRLEGLSTAPGAPASLSAEATLDGHAPLALTGNTAPTDQGLNPSLRLTVRGLDLTQLSPYALRAIAHPVSTGVLEADARLTVAGRDVNADSLLRLIRFDLGRKQQVEGASDAPVGLALSLLRDSNGDIVLDIPVRGNLDDPEFRLSRVVFRAVMNLLVKAMTSPFALIGSMFGGGASQDLDTLVMVPGRTELGPESRAKLDTVAKALAERPGLVLEIGGVALPGELPALAERRFRRAVRLARYNELKDQGQAPASVEETPLSPEEYEDALTEAYKKAPFDKPTTMLGFVADQPVAEMERMLREHLAPGSDDLPALAQRRARRVREALVERGADPARMQLVEAPAPAAGAEPGVRLFLR